MLETLFINNAWIALLAGVTFYAIGFYLPIYETYLYHAGAKNYLVFQGLYELTPALQAIAVSRRMVSPKFIATLMVLALGIAIGWTLCIQQYNRPDIFAFLIGGLLLVEVAIGMQHFRNIVLFHHVRRAEGVQGKIEYTKRLTLTLSYTELYSFVVLYLMTFLVTGSWFFLGGALTCFVASRRYRDWVIMRT